MNQSPDASNRDVAEDEGTGPVKQSEPSVDQFGKQVTMDGADLSTPADAQPRPAEQTPSIESWATSQKTQRLEDRYELEQQLGVGGMGEVWRAVDRWLQRPVAIKRLKGDLVRSTRAVERFLTEARAVARLNHPNIVQVYDCGHDAEGPFLVMELVEGESLASRLGRLGPLEPAAAIRLVGQVCDALAVAHGRRIVHRDIKPANILLTADEVPKLGDFGLARLEASDHGQTQAGAVLGTPDFMAPEQRSDAHAADARSDLWSLAATFYQLLTGQAPRVILSDRIPEPLRPILLKALDENPDERYQTVEEFRRALTGVDSSVAEFVVLDDPGEVVVKEVDVPSLHVEVLKVQKPQVALPGLPPVPPEILDLEGRLEGLNLAIQGLEDGSHASLRPGQQAVREAERQFEQIEQDLEEHCPELTDAVKQRLTQEVARDPRGSITPLCRLAPEVSTRLLLPYLQRLRNREHARRALESARQQFERMRSQQLGDLAHQRVAVADELMRRQEQALDVILAGFFQRVGAADEFPLQAWIEFEPQLEARRLSWTGRELLHRAEKRFLHWQRQPAREAPAHVELVDEQPDYVTVEADDSTARQSRQSQPLPPLADLARQVPGDENTWAMVCHLSPLCGCVIPFGNIVGPLVVWLMKRDEFPLVNDQGREALNFQISLLIYALLCVPLVLLVIGIPLLIGVGVFGLVQMILAAIKARVGIPYRYPLCMRFVD